MEDTSPSKEMNASASLLSSVARIWETRWTDRFLPFHLITAQETSSHLTSRELHLSKYIIPQQKKKGQKPKKKQRKKNKT